MLIAITPRSACLALLPRSSSSPTPDLTGLRDRSRGLRDTSCRPRAAATRDDRGRLPGTFADRSRATLSRLGIVTSARTYADAFDLVSIADADTDAEAAAAMRARPTSSIAQPRYRNYRMSWPNDPLYAPVELPRASTWSARGTSTRAPRPIVVAVLDTGVAFRSRMVRYNSQVRRSARRRAARSTGARRRRRAVRGRAGAWRRDAFVAPRDFIWNDDPVDLDGHGTHVAGTIGQLTNNSIGVAGMAYNVRIMPVKVIDGTGTSSSAARSKAPTTSWRAASATRPTTARR